jgi:hypothetical protein
MLNATHTKAADNRGNGRGNASKDAITAKTFRRWAELRMICICTEPGNTMAYEVNPSGQD